MLSTTTPDRSLDQRLTALEEANRIRSYRAQLKRELKAGRRCWLDVLDDPDCQTMKVMDVLVATPRFGRVKANRALSGARVSLSKTIGGMTTRQRDELRRVVKALTPTGMRNTNPGRFREAA